VRNIEQASISAPIDNISSADVQKAILKAGAGLGWIMKKNGEGGITGTLNLRENVDVVSIEYNTKYYSINYKDSKNLKYDGTNIHKNYMGWIMNLNNAIQIQLSFI